MRIIKSLVLAIASLPILAQYADPEMDELLDKMLFVKTEDRQQLIFKFRLCFPADSAGVMQAYHQIGEHGRKHGDVLLELCEPSGYLMLARHSATISNERQKAVIDSVYTIYKNKNVNPVFMSGMERHKGTYYLVKEKNYALAFDHYQKSIDLLKNVDPIDYPYKLNENLNLINLRIDFNDFDEALGLARDVMSYYDRVKHQRRAAEFKFSLAACFREIGQLDSSDVYLQQIMEEVRDKKDPISEGIAICYLGYNQQLRGNIHQANTLFEQGIGLLSDTPLDKSTRIFSSSFLAKNYTASGLDNAARSHLHSCEITGTKNVFYKERPIVYRNMAYVYKELGYADLALNLLDSVDVAERFLHAKYNTPKLIRAQQEKKLRMAEAEKAEIIFWRNSSLVGVSSLFILSLFYYILRYRRKTIEMAHIQAELEESKRALEKLVSVPKDLLHSDPLTTYSSGTPIAVQTLEAATILTKNDWKNFKRHFEVVYPGFLDALTKTAPDLTPSEIRYLSLKKLALTNSEMAIMLGVSETSIRTTLYRLRKKTPPSLPTEIAALLSS